MKGRKGATGSVVANKIDLALILKFGINVARAMTVVHSKGCIHRDLRTENILVRRNYRDNISSLSFILLIFCMQFRLKTSTKERSR